MENGGIIIIILLIGIALFILIAAIPLLFGKIFLKWSNKRVRYIFLQSLETVITNTVLSIILTGIILFIGIFLNSDEVFSGELLLFWLIIWSFKSIVNNIKASKNM